jgi:hypothetical protein
LPPSKAEPCDASSFFLPIVVLDCANGTARGGAYTRFDAALASLSCNRVAGLYRRFARLDSWHGRAF